MGVTPLIVDALATHRLARLLTEDTILREPREVFVHAAYESAGRAEEVFDQLDQDESGLLPDAWQTFAADDDRAPKLATLILCPHCVSVWVAIGVAIVHRFRWWRPVRNVLAVAAMVSIYHEVRE